MTRKSKINPKKNFNAKAQRKDNPKGNTEKIMDVASEAKQSPRVQLCLGAQWIASSLTLLATTLN